MQKDIKNPPTPDAASVEDLCGGCEDTSYTATISQSDANCNPSPGYWAVIPAAVRYDDQIPASAKLIYGEISSLTYKDGYCWAENSYFAELYRCTEKTIRRDLKALELRGYIRIDTTDDKRRKIYAGINLLSGQPGHFCPETWTKMSTGLDKNVQAHIMYNNKTNNTCVSESSKGHSQTAEHLPERFEKLWKYYPRDYRGHKADARKEWDRLHADDATIRLIAKGLRLDMATDEWQRGIGIPHLCRYLSKHMWEDAIERANDTPRDGDDGGWAADPEVMRHG